LKPKCKSHYPITHAPKVYKIFIDGLGQKVLSNKRVFVHKQNKVFGHTNTTFSPKKQRNICTPPKTPKFTPNLFAASNRNRPYVYFGPLDIPTPKYYCL
jgi:hypothetical protein